MQSNISTDTRTIMRVATIHRVIHLKADLQLAFGQAVHQGTIYRKASITQQIISNVNIHHSSAIAASHQTDPGGHHDHHQFHVEGVLPVS